MEQLGADVMIGPLSGDEAVAIANYARAHPTKTFIIGTAGSQDPTMQIAPQEHVPLLRRRRPVERGTRRDRLQEARLAQGRNHHGRLQLRLDVRRRASSPTSARIGGKITKRVFPPLNTTDYASYVQQLPSPDQVDGYFWVVGGTGTGPCAEGVRAGIRGDQPEEVRRQPVLRRSGVRHAESRRSSSGRTSAASAPPRA